MIANIYLEREDFDLGEHRYYACDVFINLFKEIQMDRRWGRVGGTERKLSETYPDIDAAIVALSRVQFVKQRRGYKGILCDVPDSILIKMVPKRYYPYLSLKPAQLIQNDQTLYAVVDKLREEGITYVGDLVQLSERELLEKICSAHSKLSGLRSTTERLTKNLEECLSRFGLSLNSSVPGWQRPNPVGQEPHHHPTTSRDPMLSLVHRDA